MIAGSVFSPNAFAPGTLQWLHEIIAGMNLLAALQLEVARAGKFCKAVCESEMPVSCQSLARSARDRENGVLAMHAFRRRFPSSMPVCGQRA
jgi:hypothetical protein